MYKCPSTQFVNVQVNKVLWFITLEHNVYYVVIILLDFNIPKTIWDWWTVGQVVLKYDILVTITNNKRMESKQYLMKNMFILLKTCFPIFTWYCLNWQLTYWKGRFWKVFNALMTLNLQVFVRISTGHHGTILLVTIAPK